MPNLGDYLGVLLSEITVARMHADLEAVRVAELYAGHPLLRHMPVPRFRLPDVEIDIPVAIGEMAEPASGAPLRGAPTMSEIRRTFDKALAAWAKEERIRLSAQVKGNLKSALDDKEAGIARSAEITANARGVADELSAAVLTALTDVGGPLATKEPAEVNARVARLTAAARAEFVRLEKPPPRLNVMVTTAEIREAGPSEIVTRLRLKMTEEAVEWTTIVSNGDRKDRLIAE